MNIHSTGSIYSFIHPFIYGRPNEMINGAMFLKGGGGGGVHGLAGEINKSGIFKNQSRFFEWIF
jgi:hypothetical protein